MRVGALAIEQQLFEPADTLLSSIVNLRAGKLLSRGERIGVDIAVTVFEEEFQVGGNTARQQVATKDAAEAVRPNRIAEQSRIAAGSDHHGSATEFADARGRVILDSPTGFLVNYQPGHPAVDNFAAKLAKKPVHRFQKLRASA